MCRSASATGDGDVDVVVRDDGEGFDPAASARPASACSACASGSRWCSGTLEIESAPGAGTTLHASIPTLSDSARNELAVLSPRALDAG